MWVRQSETMQPLLQQQRDRQRAMVTMMEEACTQTHTHTLDGMSLRLLTKHSVCLEPVILRSGKEGRCNHESYSLLFNHVLFDSISSTGRSPALVEYSFMSTYVNMHICHLLLYCESTNVVTRTFSIIFCSPE